MVAPPRVEVRGGGEVETPLHRIGGRGVETRERVLHAVRVVGE